MIVLSGWLSWVVGALSGWALRFLVIEPEHLQALCTGVAPPAWCELRRWVLVATFPPRFALVAGLAAVLCWFLRGRSAALAAGIALLAAGLGLFLYDTGWSASAALVALLRLPRIGEERADPREFTA